MISVIIPVYDREEILVESIESILKQTYKDFELILVTDGSPESTIKIVDRYLNHPKVKIFKFHNNTGNAVRGRNKGIREALGELIAFQDSDDISHPSRLQLCFDYIKKFNCDGVYGNWKILSDGSRKDVILTNKQVVLSYDADFLKQKELCIPCQGTVMVKREALLDIGCLKHQMEYREDHELWLRLAYFGYKIKFIPEVLTSIRIHRGNNEIKFKPKSEQYLELALKEYTVKEKMKPKIAYLLPGIGISGGVAVILQHVNRLLKKNYDVFLISLDNKTKIDWFLNYVEIVPINTPHKYLLKNIDILVATGWSTVEKCKVLNAKRKLYFVQSDERRFFDDSKIKLQIHKTYLLDFEYMTEARWIQKWLFDEFRKKSSYVPNGLDPQMFFQTTPLKPKNEKVRVLLEGPICIPFKGMSDAYTAVKDLDCEIWIISSAGKPSSDWVYDEFFEAVPIDKMKEIYSACDILLKMSRIEGFFGPPMEAMACGCAVVVANCTGCDEYIKNNENALVVDIGDIEQAKKSVKKLIDDIELRQKLIKNGYDTVKNWSWEKTIFNLEQLINSKPIDNCEPVEYIQTIYETKQVTQQKEYIENCEIIVIVHNALPYVQRCIESIRKYTDFPYKLTIVDNNSNYDTRVFLKTLENVNLILNTKNYGFGYANNQAIRVSQSKYVCFLNSDTIVTQNWLSRLIHCLEQNNAGIVGPISNFVSSEIQQVDFDYIHPLEQKDITPIEIFSQKSWEKSENKVVETNRLIGFCMVTKKEILDKAGIFDERYEFNFEDDDLGLRVIEKGYKLYCALGVFVYHYGSKTFNENSKEISYNPIFERSKKLYIEKWYNTGRIRKIQNKKPEFSIIYLLASNEPSGGVKVIFEHANRLKDRGYDVSIWCNKNVLDTWFNLHAPIFYFKEISEIPECDIAIGTYFTTLKVLQKIQAKVKLHFSQGYEALLYSEDYQALVQTIKDSYRSINEKFVVSKWLKSILDKEFSINCHYIPNGINEYVFPLKSHNRNKNPRILIVSNYNLEFKGVKTALDAVRQYLKTSKGIIVRLASEKTKFDEGCEFHDMSKMTQDEIANVYSSCDVTINAPYKVEGFSLPPLESMACGTPVITTDCGGNDYVQNGKNSLVINSSDSTAIQHALKLLFSNNVLYSRLVEGGLKTANEYLWHNSIDVLESVLHKLYANYWNMRKEQLSVCMIVKNEESCLASCLESIKPIASEIIIVDTGSTDNTIKIAKQYGAKIFHFEWIDDFSAARNFSLSQATQTWTLVLDADEIVSNIDLEKLRSLLKGEHKAYVFSTRNYVKTRDAEGVNINTGEYKNEEKNYIGWCRSDKVRLFPTNKKIKFTGQVHELVEQSINDLDIEIDLCDIPIHHYSKFNSSKNELYLKLGKEKALTTNDEKALYELGTQYMVLNNYDESIVIWRKLLEHNPKNVDALSHLGTVFNLLEDYKQAEQKFKESIKIKETEYAVKHLGICYAKQNKYEDAYCEFKKIAYKTTDFKTMTDFGYCCSTLKKYDEAIVIFEKCLKMNRKETISTGLLEIAYNEKGIELASKNNFLKAVNMFKSALFINPNFDAAKTNLSVINKLLGNTK